MLSIIAALIGLLSSTIPNILRYFERKQEITYELEMMRMKIEATIKGYEVGQAINELNNNTSATNDARRHDETLDGGEFINALRASVRPVVTYTFFGIWLFVKMTILFAFFKAGNLDLQVFTATMLDEQTLALFSLIMGFWFGARSFEKMPSINTKR